MPHATIEIQQVGRRKDKRSSGYTVFLFDGEELVAEYSAGANPRDSTAPGESPIGTVESWAKRSVNEMFSEAFGRLPLKNEVEIDIVNEE